MLVLLDTNVLLRMVERHHAQHQIALSATDRLEDLGHEAAVVPQVAYEFSAVATRPVSVNGLGLQPAQAQFELDELLLTMRLLRDERMIFEHWRQLIASHSVSGKQVHDARLVAAMLRHRISYLITFNGSDFRRYDQIFAVEPEQVSSQIPAA